LEKLAAEKSVLAPIRLTARLSNGEEHVREVIEARGCPSNRLERRELEAKFLECANQLLPPEQSKMALDFLNRIETVGKVSEITEILTPKI
jgi:2-methylcitrate dehydratase PrpD